MNFVNHIKRAIDAYNQQDFEDSLLHSCIAVDCASRKWAGKKNSSKLVYKNFIREYDWLIEKFAGVSPGLIKRRIGIDHQVLWQKTNNQQPDFADLIYHIFRCSTCHGDEIPINYELCFVQGVNITRSSLGIEDGCLNLPTRLIFGLLAACVFNAHSKDIRSDDTYFLSYDTKKVVSQNFLRTCGYTLSTIFLQPGEVTEFPLSEWWGREADIRNFLQSVPEQIPFKQLMKVEAGEQIYYMVYILPA